MAQITKEAVFAAADALAESGEKITQQKVRDAVGGGSFSTIGPLLSEWEESRAEVQKARAVPLPEAVQAVLDDAAARLWKAASDTAAIGLEAARQEVDAAKAKAANEVQEAREVVVLVEGERDAAQAEASRLREVLAEAEAVARREVETRHAAEVAKAAAEVRAEALEQAVKVAEAAKAEADARTVAALAERDAARRETEEVRKAGLQAADSERLRAADAMREERRVHEDKVSDLEQDAAGLRRMLMQKDAELTERQKRLMEYKRQLDEAEAKAKAPRKAPRKPSAKAAAKPKVAPAA